MDPIERAARLRAEADLVLQELKVRSILECYSTLYPTGSYFLDLMAYPDIDLMIDKVPVETMFSIAAQLAASDLVTQVTFEKGPADDPQLAGGLYLKPRVRFGSWGRPWKIDIWSFDAPLIERKTAEMSRFQTLLTPGLRAKILQYKCGHLTPEGRTPMYSGYFIYKAVLDEGLLDDRDITHYLQDHGIKVD